MEDALAEIERDLSVAFSSHLIMLLECITLETIHPAVEKYCDRITTDPIGFPSAYQSFQKLLLLECSKRWKVCIEENNLH